MVGKITLSFLSSSSSLLSSISLSKTSSGAFAIASLSSWGSSSSSSSGMATSEPSQTKGCNQHSSTLDDVGSSERWSASLITSWVQLSYLTADARGVSHCVCNSSMPSQWCCKIRRKWASVRRNEFLNSCLKMLWNLHSGNCNASSRAVIWTSGTCCLLLYLANAALHNTSHA